MTTFKRLRHAIAHYFGWNIGEVETRWNGNVLMVGFRCHGCGKLMGEHESKIGRQP